MLRLGCDYNFEQWSPAVWREDMALMREAGVDLVAVNVFGWSQIEPRPGEYDLGRWTRLSACCTTRASDSTWAPARRARPRG
jgi:beta-galactosidase GanA